MLWNHHGIIGLSGTTMLRCNIINASQLVLLFCNSGVYAQSDSCDGYYSYLLGDGHCHELTNNELCNYDEGGTASSTQVKELLLDLLLRARSRPAQTKLADIAQQLICVHQRICSSLGLR